MSFYQNLYSLLARCLVGLAFLVPAIVAISDPQAATLIQGHAYPEVLLWAAVLLLLLGSLSLILGIYTDLGAVLLLLFLVPYLVVFHSQITSLGQLYNLLGKLALGGGLIYVYLWGPGEWNVVTEERYLLARKSSGSKKSRR